MNENAKKKMSSLKQKIKTYAPSVIAFTAAASTALALKAIKNATEFVPLPEVTGDEKKALLEREDVVVQQSGLNNVYYLTIYEDTNEN